MKQSKVDRLLLGASIGGFAVLAISFLLMPVEELGFVPGILFWGGLIIGAALQIMLETRRRSLFAKYNVNRKTMQKPRNGLLSFASNRIAAIGDGLLAVSAVVTVAAFILTKGTGYLCYAGLSMLVFFFCMHCIFNGRNYIYVKNQTKIRQVLEQKKANSSNKGEGKNEKN